MSFEIGSIILVRNYPLPTKVSDKFFIVIGIRDDSFTLLSMTTSQIYFDISLLKEGIITENDVSIYCFLKGQIIGKEGFCFRKNTFISHRNNISQFHTEKLKSFDVELMDVLIKSQIVSLLYSFYIYKGTKNKNKLIIENLLYELTKDSEL